MSIVRTRRSARLAAVAAVAAVGVLAGCATRPATTATEEIDYVKVAQIERAARYFGTQVIWVNFPTKTVDATKQ